ncbi:MAG: hypothetical protein HY510_05615 [Acidobacteria bacterium]|nr:hypothetical protein [Acidobacteriota bacterium]
MTGGTDPAYAGLLQACGAGEFVLSFRNRPIGRESARAIPTPGGGLGLRVETALEVGRFLLRQEVVVDLDCALRPKCCRVTTVHDSQQMYLEMNFDQDRVVARYVRDGRERCRSIALDHPPLLLVDNCFSLHALAAVIARRRSGSETIFTSVPAAADLTVTAPGIRPVLLGGRDFGPPTLTLHLAPDLQEHAWIRGGWAERLVVPQAQMCVDWVRKEGGGLS